MCTESAKFGALTRVTHGWVRTGEMRLSSSGVRWPQYKCLLSPKSTVYWGWCVLSLLCTQSSVSSVCCILSNLCPQAAVYSVISVLSLLCTQSSVSSVCCVLNHLCPQSAVNSVICVLSHLCPQSAEVEQLSDSLHWEVSAAGETEDFKCTV